MKKTFLLGIGAQKAGTTWLYQYLRGHPECSMGSIKEHAVLQSALSDVRPSERFGQKVTDLSKSLARFQTAAADGTQTDDAQRQILELMDNIAGEFDLSYYKGTFDRRLMEKPGAHLTGDITPEYCMLSADQLRRARDMIEGEGYHLKVVFLMRDPLDRIYSALRMADRNRLNAGKKVVLPAAERFDLQGVADWVERRTRYEDILHNIDAAFRPDQVYLGFYETFFSQQTLTELLSFLGLGDHPANFGHMANASPAGGKIAQDKVEKIRAYYDDTYRVCAERFGQDFIGRIWPNA